MDMYYDKDDDTIKRFLHNGWKKPQEKKDKNTVQVTSELFTTLIEVIEDILDPNFPKYLERYGTNMEQWGEEVLKRIKLIKEEFYNVHLGMPKVISCNSELGEDELDRYVLGKPEKSFIDSLANEVNEFFGKSNGGSL